MLLAPSPTETQPNEVYATEAARANLRLILLEAVLWSSTRADWRNPVGCLRSPTLTPYAFSSDRHDAVADVARRRHRALNADVPSLGALRPLLGKGRLLAWERDTTIDDGVGAIETKGYLDESDMPPWDTWIAYLETTVPDRYFNCLVSWVPAPFVEMVGKAIAANAYGALYWLTDANLPTITAVLLADDLLV